MILDVGGVLAHDIWEPMFDDLAKQYRRNRKKLHAAGRLLWETFAYVPETPANTWRDMQRRYWELFLLISRLPVTVASLIRLTDRYVIPVEGMRPILEKLRARGTPLVICSNNNEIWWPRQAKKLQLKRFFGEERLVLSSRVGAPKASPRLEMFRAAVAAAGVPAASCFFVDDRRENITRARRFGIDAMLFRGPEHFAAALRKRKLL
ncbi:MAG TPA: HAD-IA family hydrolase [Burkholderiales bacterium]